MSQSGHEREELTAASAILLRESQESLTSLIASMRILLDANAIELLPWIAVVLRQEDFKAHTIINLMEKISKLKPNEYRIFSRMFLVGMTKTETAKDLGIDISTINRQFKKVIAKIPESQYLLKYSTVHRLKTYSRPIEYHESKNKSSGEDIINDGELLNDEELQ